jgi:hypothetical protein
MLVDARVEDDRAECVDVFFACASDAATVRVLRCGEVVRPVRALSQEQRLVDATEPNRRPVGVRIHIPGLAARGEPRHVSVELFGAIPLRAICRRPTLAQAHLFRWCVAYPLVDVYTNANAAASASEPGGAGGPARVRAPLPSLTVPGTFVLEGLDDGEVAVFHRPMTFTHKRCGAQRVVVTLADGTVVKETVGDGRVVSTGVPLTHALAVVGEERDAVRDNLRVVKRRDGTYGLVSKLPLIVGA